jgi:hypothetical protein
VYCNWNETLCEGLTLEECDVLCVENKTSEFCAICENGEDCVQFEISEQDCLSTTVCVLPNGTYALNISEAECVSYGKCSMNCPDRCEVDFQVEK